jgi:hypothetical protein
MTQAQCPTGLAEGVRERASLSGQARTLRELHAAAGLSEEGRMALRIEVFIEGHEDEGPINLLASLAKLREQLQRVDDAQQTTVTLRLSSVFAARQTNAGDDWEPQGALSRVWAMGDWVVYAKPDVY